MRTRRIIGAVAQLCVSYASLTGCGAGGGGEGDLDVNTSELFSDVQSEAVSAEIDNFQNRGKWIDYYATYPARCVAKVDELDGSKALFHGCFDWHSSVHAHWAVLRADLTGLGGSAQLATAIDQRLTVDQLSKVKKDLEGDAAYEMPYGRAWLLRLVSEHERWSTAKGKANATRMRALGDFTAESLVKKYDATPPDPRKVDYDNDPWAVAQMVAWFRYTGDQAGLAKVTDWVEKRFVQDPVTWAETNDRDPSAFFSKYWSWVYAVSETLDSAKAIDVIKPESIPAEAITPVADPQQTSEVHHIGINWSRAWAIKSLAAQLIAVRGAGDSEAKRMVAAYNAHVLAGRQRHEKYQGDYRAYDHWVPQFGIYAITD